MLMVGERADSKFGKKERFARILGDEISKQSEVGTGLSKAVQESAVKDTEYNNEDNKMRVVGIHGDRHTRASSEFMKNTKEEDSTASFSWWQDSHSRPPQSPWLQATLSDLDEKTKVMVSIIDQKNDGDSFARRAEMFYTRRPELVGTIHDLYRSYGSLARRYKQLSSPVLNLESDSSSSLSSSSASSSSSAIENGGRSLGYDKIKVVSEEKKVKDKIAETRLRDLKLAESNFNEQAELIRTNNDTREAIKLFCTRVKRIVDEHKDLKDFFRSHSSTSTP